MNYLQALAGILLIIFGLQGIISKVQSNELKTMSIGNTKIIYSLILSIILGIILLYELF